MDRILGKIDCWLRLIIRNAVSASFWLGLICGPRVVYDTHIWRTQNAWTAKGAHEYQIRIDTCEHCEKVEVYHNFMVTRSVSEVIEG